MSTTEKICPICEEGRLSDHTGSREASYKGDTRKIPFYYSECNFCGCESADATHVRENKRAMLAFKKEVDGLLTGQQIRRFRESVGITQVQAAKIFGGGPVAFSKYEKDDVVQSEPMDKLLKVAKSIPQAFLWLARKANEGEVAKKASFSFSHFQASLSKDAHIIAFNPTAKSVTTTSCLRLEKGQVSRFEADQEQLSYG